MVSTVFKALFPFSILQTWRLAF